jgi:hypothetical protein
MNWNDLPDDGQNVNYWKLIENENRETIFQKILTSIRIDPAGKKMLQWLDTSRKGLMKSYIQGITDLREEALNISLHTFGLMVFVTLHVTHPNNEIEEYVGLKPQSIQLQNELDDMYNDDNIKNAIKELGIFTDDKGEIE